jgi:protein-tyrosine phosphatase
MSGWPSERSRHGGVDEIPLRWIGGRLWLCGKHFVGPDPEGALAGTGASAVVCLCEEHELADRYPDYVRWLREQSPTRAIWSPIPDLHAPTVDGATLLVARLRGRLDAGEGLLMHCGAGIGRAGTMAAAVLMSTGMARTDAVTLVAACRPMAGPEAGAQAALLESLARPESAAAPPISESSDTSCGGVVK